MPIQRACGVSFARSSTAHKNNCTFSTLPPWILSNTHAITKCQYTRAQSLGYLPETQVKSTLLNVQNNTMGRLWQPSKLKGCHAAIDVS